MSVAVLSEAWLYSRASSGTLLVLLAIADNAEPDGGIAWPREDTIAVKARLSTRQVQRAIQELQSLGELDVWEYIRNGNRKNAYRVVVGEYAAYKGLPIDELIKRETGGSVRRKKLPKATRTRILERDGWKCVLCGISRDLQIDHIHPVSKGGSDADENLQVLCRPCNIRKADKTDSRLPDATPTSRSQATPMSPKEPSREPPKNRNATTCRLCGIAPKGKTLAEHLEDVHGVRAA